MQGISLTHDEWVSRFNKKYPDVKVVGEYTKSSQRIELYCNKCYHTWNLKAGTACGCPSCYNISKLNTHEVYLKKLIEKNITDVEPIEQYIGCDTKILHRCLKCSNEWMVKPSGILGLKSDKNGCPVCCNHVVVVGKNSLWDLNPQIAALLKNKEDGYKYTRCSRVRLDFICPDCGLLLNKDLSNVSRKGLKCDRCSDGISVPQKFMHNILSQLNIDYEFEKMFSWSDLKRYDFYINNLDCIIEVHGSGHYEKSWEKVGGRTLQEEQSNDIYKRQLAETNNISKYIVINAQESELDYMKNSILSSELIKYYEFSNIDWELAFNNSQKSLLLEACKLWDVHKNSVLIANILNVTRGTTVEYLKKGAKYGLCNYKGLGEKNRSVICLTTKKIFEQMKHAAKEYGLTYHDIKYSCLRNGNVSNKYNKNRIFSFMYYDDYLQLNGGVC